MKAFRDQFKECVENKTAEVFKLKMAETIIPAFNINIDSVKIEEVLFCNKYMKRCSSSVCKKERLRL